jgi:hypothetical protein
MTAAPGPRSSRPRSEANYGPQRGTTYLIHIDPPYKHAKHYKGWTDRPVARRFADHLAGRGALLTRMAVQAGSRLTLARVWPNTTKDREDSIKHRSGVRMCPECGVKPAAPRLASDRAPEVADRRPMWMADRDGQWNDGTPIIFDPDQTWEQARALRAAMQIPEPDPAGQAELAALDELQRQWNSQEDQVGLRNALARGAAAMRGIREGHQRAASGREADRLWAIADELEKQMGRQPGYQHELTAERAARIRARLGEDLARDAHIEAMPQAEGQPLEHWAITPDDVARAGREPVLQGAERDAEIDRLAAAFPESGWPPVPGRDATAAEVATWEEWAWEQGEREAAEDRADSDRRWAEIEAAHNEADPEGGVAVFGGGVEAPGPEHGDDAATWSPALEGVEPGSEPDEVALWEEALWEEHQRETAGEPGEDAATWSPALEDADPDAEVSDFPYLTERPAEPAPEPGDGTLHDRAAYAEAVRQAEARALARQHIAQEEHDAAGVAAAREEANAARQARLTTQAEAYNAAAALQAAALNEAHAEPMERMPASRAAHPGAAPVASTLPDGTAHTDPALAERGWQAGHHGVYVRNPDAEASGARRELAGYEADSPDHQYGSPDCAEADPEGAHFGRMPGEPMDTGRWPVLQADYGRMYIGQPQAQAEAV